MKLKNTTKYLSLPAKILTTLIVVLVGICLLQFIAMAAILGIMPEEPEQQVIAEPKLTETETYQKRISQAKKKFLPDGTIHLLHQVENDTDSEGLETQIEVRDVNDNLLWMGNENEVPYKSEYLSWPMGQLGHAIKFFEPALFREELIIPVISGTNKVKQYWRYEQGSDYFVGFGADGRKNGYAGSNGFKKSKHQIKPFKNSRRMEAWCPKNSSSILLLWQTAKRLYEINFSTHTIGTIFYAEEAWIDNIFEYNWSGIEKTRDDDIDRSKYRPVLYITTKDGQHHLILREPDEHLTLKIPDSWQQDEIKIAATIDAIFLRHHGNEIGPVPKNAKLISQWRKQHLESHKRWIELYEINENGHLEFLNRFEWVHPARRLTFGQLYSVYGSRNEKIKYYLRLISPPVYEQIWHWYKSHYHPILKKEITVSSMMIEVIINLGSFAYLYKPETHFTCRPANWALSLLMVFLALWHGRSRRTSWTKFIFWLIFVGAFNVAGLLTYLALNHTPTIKCPACHRRRGLERIDCVRCGARLPVPEKRKVDLIFDK